MADRLRLGGSGGVGPQHGTAGNVEASLSGGGEGGGSGNGSGTGSGSSGGGEKNKIPQPQRCPRFIDHSSGHFRLILPDNSHSLFPDTEMLKGIIPLRFTRLLPPLPRLILAVVQRRGGTVWVEVMGLVVVALEVWERCLYLPLALAVLPIGQCQNHRRRRQTQASRIPFPNPILSQPPPLPHSST
jgi:hypothetical protein